MPRVPLPRPPLLWLLLLLGLARVAAGADFTEVWTLLANTQNAEAQAALHALRGPAGEPERRVAAAVVRMARQPVTEEALRQAEAELTAVAAGEGETAALAGYLRARLWQVHHRTPDYARAAQLYRELAQRAPQSHWARLGLVKLGFLTLYTLPDPADPAARLHAAAALLSAIAEPPLQRDLSLQLARASVIYQRPVTETIAYLQAVDRVGGLVGPVAEDVVIQLGELSFRAGRLAEARVYFERLLRDYPTNNRSFNIERRLAKIAELESAPSGRGGAP